MWKVLLFFSDSVIKRNATKKVQKDGKNPIFPLNLMLFKIQARRNVRNSLNIRCANFGRIWWKIRSSLWAETVLVRGLEPILWVWKVASSLRSTKLNPGEREFALGILLVGATRTKSFECLAFNPYPNFARFEQLRKSKALIARKAEEKRMSELELITISKYQL